MKIFIVQYDKVGQMCMLKLINCVNLFQFRQIHKWVKRFLRQLKTEYSLQSSKSGPCGCSVFYKKPRKKVISANFHMLYWLFSLLNSKTMSMKTIITSIRIAEKDVVSKFGNGTHHFLKLWILINVRSSTTRSV